MTLPEAHPHLEKDFQICLAYSNREFALCLDPAKIPKHYSVRFPTWNTPSTIEKWAGEKVHASVFIGPTELLNELMEISGEVDILDEDLNESLRLEWIKNGLMTEHDQLYGVVLTVQTVYVVDFSPRFSGTKIQQHDIKSGFLATSRINALGTPWLCELLPLPHFAASAYPFSAAVHPNANLILEHAVFSKDDNTLQQATTRLVKARVIDDEIGDLLHEWKKK